MTGNDSVSVRHKATIADQIVKSVGILRETTVFELRSKLESLDSNFLKKLTREIRGTTPNEALDLIVCKVDFFNVIEA